MQLPYSLLTGPLSRNTRWPQRTWFWPTPADQSVPDQPPLVQYKFRRGGFYQLLNRPALYPTPADQSIPNQPPLTPYTFRPGGYWQTQKALLFPTPADQSVPDRPLVRQYVFRRGGIWQVQKFAPVLDSVVAPPSITAVGGELGRVVSDTWRGIGWRPSWLWALPEKDYEPVLLALLAGGAITEEEFMALLAAMRGSTN